MSKNTLDIQINPVTIKKDKRAGFTFTLKIDGVPINEQHHVDLCEITNLITKKDRDYVYFWNCDCGIPECAGIESSQIKENKNQGELMVLIPVPCSIYDFEEKTYKHWQTNHKKVVARLDKLQIAKKIWDLSFDLEKEMEKCSKNNFLLAWPTTTSYYDYKWPRNLPIYLRTTLLKAGFYF